MSEQIEKYMRALKLGGLAKEWQSVNYHNNEQFVMELLEIELKEREINRINRMVKIAGFRVIKTLEDFVWTPSVEIPQGLAKEDMETFVFIKKKENLIFMGAVGTGKTHLAIAIALKACQNGKHTRFFTATSLANPVSYTHLRAHETRHELVCCLL